MKGERDFSNCLHSAQTFKAYKEHFQAKLREQVSKLIIVEITPPISCRGYLKYQKQYYFREAFDKTLAFNQQSKAAFGNNLLNFMRNL